MTSAICSVLSFLGRDTRLEIPIYQRKYNWTKENCEQLYTDIKKLASGENNSKHFFGSIVFCRCQDKDYRQRIIDGQQRLITITLFLTAIRDLCESGKAQYRNPIYKEDADEKWYDFPDKIQRDYLAFQEKTLEGTRMRPESRLILRECDRDELDRLIFRKNEKADTNSYINTNYRYFCDWICNESPSENGKIDVTDLCKAIDKLEINTLALTNDDDAQHIFESINSTGMPLTVGDKIRNYILMGFSSGTNDYQEQIYDSWCKIEECTCHSVEHFITCFLNIDGRGDARARNVYRSFKKYAEEGSKYSGIDERHNHDMTKFDYVECLLNEIHKYAEYYNVLCTYECGFKTKEREMNYCLRRLGELGITYTYPFFMKVLERHDDDESTDDYRLTDDDVLKIFETTETYIFRRTVCNYGSQGLNKLFVSLDKVISEMDGKPNDYFSRFVYALMNRWPNFRLPSDEDFDRSLKTENFYRKYALYALERYEHRLRSKGAKEHYEDVYGLIKKNKWSVEHIMPQNPRNMGDWPVDNDTHKQYVHKLGNLSLSGYNSELSNRSFQDKRENIDDCYKKSGVLMNQEIAANEVWGPVQIENRTNEMAKIAVTEIWRCPEEVKFEYAVSGIKCTLKSDDLDFSRRTLLKFSFQSTVRSDSDDKVEWADMFDAVLEALFKKSQTTLFSLAIHGNDVDSDWKNYVAKSKEGLGNSTLQFTTDDGEDVYVKNNFDPNNMVSALRKFFDLYGIDYDDLNFQVSNYEEKRRSGGKRYNPRQHAIYAVLVEWATSRAEKRGDIEFNPDYSKNTCKFVRFTTPRMSAILPLCEEGQVSGWYNRHNYFYEICNLDGGRVFIKLTLNSTGASDEFKKKCDVINKLMPGKYNFRNWQWRIPFETSSIDIGEDILRQDIFDGLDKCLDEIFEFEYKIKAMLEPVQ